MTDIEISLLEQITKKMLRSHNQETIMDLNSWEKVFDFKDKMEKVFSMYKFERLVTG